MEFIKLYENNLGKDICDIIIEKFDNDIRKQPGVVGSGLNLQMKNTMDLHISTLDDWKWIDDILFEKLHKALKNYQEILMISINQIKDSGYKIQRYIKNEGYYHWHDDQTTEKLGERVLTFIWYLNDVEEGGETEFLSKTDSPNYVIKAKKGNLLLFPATWTYIHRGVMPRSNNKYICNGWIYRDTQKQIQKQDNDLVIRDEDDI